MADTGQERKRYSPLVLAETENLPREQWLEYRRQGIGRALEAFLINLHLSMGYTPYGMVAEGNEASLSLQNRLGLCISKERLYWIMT